MFVAGVIVGVYLFSGAQPRSFLTLRDCGASCYRKKDLAGLLPSVGIQHASSFIPQVAKETNRCIAIMHPLDDKRYHAVIFTKRDIKDIGDVALGDEPYVMDRLGVIRALVTEDGLRDYWV